MTVPRDNDDIRALGYLTLYSGNLEACLRETLELVQSWGIVEVDPNARTLGGKTKELKRLQNHYHAKQLSPHLIEIADWIDNYIEHLSDFIMQWRNPLIHGSITNPKNLGLELNDRGNKRPIVAEEIYDGAEIASDLFGMTLRFRFDIGKVL